MCDHYLKHGTAGKAPKSNFNRFAVVQTCVDHTFVSDKAERDFGYKPIVSKEEVFERTVQWFENNTKNQE